MPKILLNKDFLINELYLPYENYVEKKLIEKTRWSLVYEIVFEYDNKFYQTTYSTGATEMQEEEPWEYLKEVKCTEVKKVKVLKEEWIPIDSIKDHLCEFSDDEPLNELKKCDEN